MSLFPKAFEAKILVPPLVTTVFTVLFHLILDLILGRQNDSDLGTAGIIFLIETILIFVLIIIGILIHGFFIVKAINRNGTKGYLNVIIAGLVGAFLISVFYIEIILEDSTFTSSAKLGSGLELFLNLIFILAVDLIALVLVKRRMEKRDI